MKIKLSQAIKLIEAKTNKKVVLKEAIKNAPKKLKVKEFLYFENGEDYGDGVFFEKKKLNSKKNYPYLEAGDILEWYEDNERYETKEGSDMDFDVYNENKNKFQIV